MGKGFDDMGIPFAKTHDLVYLLGLARGQLPGLYVAWRPWLVEYLQHRRLLGTQADQAYG